MKFARMINFRMLIRFWEFLSFLTGSRERDFEDERKRSILAFFLILGVGIAFPFAIHHFSLGNVTRAIILLCVGSIQLASLIALRYLKRAHIIFRLNVFLLGAYFLFLIILGGTQGSRILWVFIFPIYAFFLLGKREGLFWSVLLILFSLLLFVNPANFIGTYPYASETKTRFITTYTLLLLMGYFVETMRERYQEIFQDHTGFQTTLATIRGLGPDKSEADFWQAFLSSIVKEYGFLMAWYGSYSDGQVVPKHSAGLVDRYLDDLVLKIAEPTSPDARCAMSRAIIDGQPFGYEDLAHDEGFHSWRDYALELGYCSNVALPFKVNGQIEGGIMIYADTVSAFPAKRVEHLRFLTSEMENILHERRLAQQAKVALQKSHEDLEKRVETRTAELREANEGLEKEIIERQHTEEELRSSERRLSDIINFLPDATFVIDLEGKVIAWNRATEELTGIKADEMVGKGDYEYAIPFYGQRRPIMIDLSLQWDEKIAEQYEFVRREGDTLISETRNPPFRKESSRFWNTSRPLHKANGSIIGAIEVIRDVTDRMLAEEALKDAANEKDIILSSLMEFVLYEDRDMNILWANRAACNSVGMEPDEIVGRHCYEIWEQRQDPCPDCPVQKAIETGEPHEIERTTPDGKSWIIRGYPVQDANDDIIGGLEVALDITERKKTEMALKEASDIINKSPAVAFLWKNEEGWPVEFASENLKDLFGYTVEDFISGKVSYSDTVYPDDLARVGQEVSTFSTEEEREAFVHKPYRIITKSGEVKWVNDQTYIRRDKKGRITHYQGIVEDITNQKQAEEELAKHRERLEELVKERTRELETAQDEIMKRERLSVLGQLTATVSHELRNPLGVIRSSSFYLQKKSIGEDEKVKKHINRIENQVEICDSIVADLLEFTRGRHSQMVESEINPWIEQTLNEVLEAEDVELTKLLDQNLPMIHFDKEKIRRVMVNLMDNALQAIKEKKSMEKDGTYQPEIEISSKGKAGGVMIMIKDNGIGMDEEAVERAFEPLFTTRARGTGLGLANVEKIIEEHKGSILLESKPHKGTTVIITIPAEVQ